MFLLDLNQITLSNLLVEIGNHKNVTIEESMVRHMILNSIRYNRQKFLRTYGEPILCCDNKNYWRKKIFPNYKANRKKYQEQSELDWDAIFSFLNRVKQELKDHFPYKVLDVETAEADDIIGTIVHEYGTHDPILILSGDKDFIQLQVYDNVKQYDPIRKKWIGHEEPDMYLYDHIIRGDRGDGIPNILSEDDCLVKNIRQKSITKKIMDGFHNNPATLDSTHYLRNEQLIDLEKVPPELKSKIMKQYYDIPTISRAHLLPYFIEHKLKHLLEHLSEF